MSDLEDAIEETIEKLKSNPEDLPKRTEEEEIEIKKVDETVKHGDPCYKAAKGDSWMDLVHHEAEDILYISHVWMEYKGDFSKLMDELVQRFETRHIKFTMVINDNLKEVLHDFEEKTEIHEGLNEEITVLEGEWHD